MDPAGQRVPPRPVPSSGLSSNDNQSTVVATDFSRVKAAASSRSTGNHRILIVDDNPAIHDDFRKVLAGNLGAVPELLRAEQALFGDDPLPKLSPDFELDSAY